MSERILVLGAGFGGLELATILSEAFGDEAGVTLIEGGDAFVFGYSKLDVMFGHARRPRRCVSRTRGFGKAGVRFLNETIMAIDPEARRVTTDAGEHEADILVVALGADYDFAATPGLIDGGNEFYSVAGAERIRAILPTFTAGHAVVGVCGAPFKCPPAPSEAALLLHDFLVRARCPRRLRDLARHAVPGSGTAVARHVRGAARGVRRARHRLRGRAARSPRSIRRRAWRRSRTGPSSL